MVNKADFTEGSITKKLIGFMLPTLGALILQALYGAVDVLVVGQFGSDTGISGVSTGSSIIHMLTVVVAAFSMAVTVLIGRYLGEKKDSQVSEVIGGAVAFFLVVSLILTVLVIVFARPLAIIMKAPDEAINDTVSYVRICGGGLVFIIAYNLLSSIFRGLGNSKLPLLFVGIACVVNIVGDLLLVAVFNMNTAGAAIATVLAQAVSVVLSILILRKQKLPFTFSLKKVRFNKEIKKFVRIGYPIALQDLLTQISFLALLAFINNLGLDQSNGYGVAHKVQAFVMLIPGALMQSMSAFVSQNVGAGNEIRATKAMVTGMTIGSIIGFGVAILTFFFGDIVSMAFTSDPAIISQSFDFLKGFALEAIITCIMFSYIGYFNGHNQTLFVMIQGLIQSLLIRLPMSYVMSSLPNTNLTLIALAAPTATIIGIIINTIYFFHYKKKLQEKSA